MVLSRKPGTNSGVREDYETVPKGKMNDLSSKILMGLLSMIAMCRRQSKMRIRNFRKKTGIFGGRMVSFKPNMTKLAEFVIYIWLKPTMHR